MRAQLLRNSYPLWSKKTCMASPADPLQLQILPKSVKGVCGLPLVRKDLSLCEWSESWPPDKQRMKTLKMFFYFVDTKYHLSPKIPFYYSVITLGYVCPESSHGVVILCLVCRPYHNAPAVSYFYSAKGLHSVCVLNFLSNLQLVFLYSVFCIL